MKKVLSKIWWYVLLPLILWLLIISLSVFIERFSTVYAKGIEYIGLYAIMLYTIIIVEIVMLRGLKKVIVYKSIGSKKQLLFYWMDDLSGFDKELMEIIGESKSSNVMDNLITIKNKLLNYVNNDLDRLKLLKGYLTAKANDNVLNIFLTFVLGLITALIVATTRTGSIQALLPNIANTQEGVSLPAEFILFLECTFLGVYILVNIVIVIVIANSTKTRHSLVNQVVDTCIQEIEKKEEKNGQVRQRKIGRLPKRK